MYDIGQAEIEAVIKVITSKQFMRYRGGEGGYTEQFEKALQDKFQVRHALTVNSGTSALIGALAAMGIGPGDEVIVPAYTWVATAMAPLAVGAVPVMADIDESLTIDPEDIGRKITPYTKAIIPVHMINQPCDMDAIMAIAKKHHLLVCEDACQACGVSYKGKRVGTIGHTGALSFNQFKNITCGEGGAVLTN
ncbi:MAG: aminotransferase class I/II-fold pyridoxal phosphate-dependent enzyme, partial [Lentisphaeria bacterium]